MTKKTVNYDRQKVTFSDISSGYDQSWIFTLESLTKIMTSYVSKWSIPIDRISIEFNVDHGYYPGDAEKQLIVHGWQYETDFQYNQRIAKEEAAIARDHENARKSKESTRERELKELKRLQKKYQEIK